MKRATFPKRSDVFIQKQPLEMFCKKRQSWPATLETLTQKFSCKFCEIPKKTLFTEHLWATASVYFGKNLVYFFFKIRINQISHNMLRVSPPPPPQSLNHIPIWLLLKWPLTRSPIYSIPHHCNKSENNNRVIALEIALRNGCSLVNLLLEHSWNILDTTACNSFVTTLISKAGINASYYK